MPTPQTTVLLAVTGATPQVVTETLYGIYKQGLEWPDKIMLITTSFGKEQARLNLITDKKLQAFCDEYDLVIPEFAESDIHVIPDAHGRAVADARTIEDQEALADFIVEKVAKLTLDDSIRIHASLAGGRKTMTFFLGYAMSIFAREYDRLSHVLVSEEFESNPQFYYPTKAAKIIANRDNVSLDCSQAEVMLAEIPLISQRMVNPKIVNEFSTFKYNDIVNAIQLANRPERVSLELVLDKSRPRIVFGGQEISFINRKGDFAFLAAFARAKLNQQPGFKRQSNHKESNHFTFAFLKELCLLEKLPFQTENLPQLLEDLTFVGAMDSKTAMVIERYGEFSEDNFSDKRTSLQKTLSSFLPKAAVNLLVPQTHGQHNPYQLQIPAENIKFIQE